MTADYTGRTVPAEALADALAYAERTDDVRGALEYVEQALAAASPPASDAGSGAGDRIRVTDGVVALYRPGPVRNPWHCYNTYDGSFIECRTDEAVAKYRELPAALAASSPPASDPETLARRFHETYERLAPSFGYETREASAKPWAQVPENNCRLMIAVCEEIAAAQPEPPPRTAAEILTDLRAQGPQHQKLREELPEHYATPEAMLREIFTAQPIPSEPPAGEAAEVLRAAEHLLVVHSMTEYSERDQLEAWERLTKALAALRRVEEGGEVSCCWKLSDGRHALNCPDRSSSARDRIAALERALEEAKEGTE